MYVLFILPNVILGCQVYEKVDKGVITLKPVTLHSYMLCGVSTEVNPILTKHSHGNTVCRDCFKMDLFYVPTSSRLGESHSLANQRHSK